MTQTTTGEPSKAFQINPETDFDILIVGAGISGLGAAWHIENGCPGKSWRILEQRESFGGTWDFHKYPGIRSDSDLYTFGYSFKPWSGAPVAEAPVILSYLRELIDDNKFSDKILYQRVVTAADWCSTNKRWFLTVQDISTNNNITYSCKFLNMCQGYYNYDQPHKPTWPDMDTYRGDVVHPMEWKPDYDYTGKKVVVIGSGATAATLIPKIAEKADHVTMVQRSPTYFYAAPNRIWLHDMLTALRLPHKWVHALTRRFLLTLQRYMHWQAARNPEKAKRFLFKALGKHLPRDIIEKHFTPSYRPWQQRVAFLPEGDMFKAMNAGKVSIETDTIEQFTQTGLRLTAGAEVDADLIITATGFNLLIMGGIPFSVDGEQVDFSKRYTHRGIMMEGLPNLIYFFGYLRTSWTMRVDLLCAYQIRLLQHMDRKNVEVCTPIRQPEHMNLPAHPWISEEDFSAGYLLRSSDKLPRNGGEEPWTFDPDYYRERETFPKFDLDDPSMVYS